MVTKQGLFFGHQGPPFGHQQPRSSIWSPRSLKKCDGITKCDFELIELIELIEIIALIELIVLIVLIVIKPKVVTDRRIHGQTQSFI